MRVPNRMLYRAELEMLFNEAPDGGDGSLERWVAIVCSGVALLVFSGLARREKRRLGIAH
jgi:hypothetical protein